MRSTNNFSGYTVGMAEDWFVNNASDMQAQFMQNVQDARADFNNTMQKMQDDFNSTSEEIYRNNMRHFENAAEAMLQSAHDREEQNRREYETVAAQQTYPSTVASRSNNLNNTDTNIFSSISGVLFLGILLALFIALLKGMKRSSRSSTAGRPIRVRKDFVQEEQMRHEEEMRGLEEMQRIQEEMFRQQMLQAQDEIQRQEIERQAQEFQMQMQRDMETAQMAHEEAVRQAEYNQWEFDQMQQDMQLQQQMMNQTFNDFNNGF